MSDIFKDKTEMPAQPDIAVSSVKVPGYQDRGDMRMAGQKNYPDLRVENVRRPRFGHDVS